MPLICHQSIHACILTSWNIIVLYKRDFVLILEQVRVTFFKQFWNRIQTGLWPNSHFTSKRHKKDKRPASWLKVIISDIYITISWSATETPATELRQYTSWLRGPVLGRVEDVQTNILCQDYITQQPQRGI